VTALVRAGRLLAAGWRFHVKNLSTSGFFLITTVFLPLILATVAYYMFKAGQRPGTLLYVSLGAGVMGIWSSTLFGSGGAIQWQRWQGTLEMLVASPAPFVLILLPLTLATSTIGIYSLVSTLVWGRLLFGVPFTIAHPALFVLSIPVALISLGLLGLLIASTFVLYRHANALSNMLEFPVLFVTGLLVPISMLPGWVHPIGWVLAPTWGVRAIRMSALGGDPWPALGLSAALGLAYLVLGTIFLDHFLRLARRHATLSLT
jgi:ABC-type multidrug transport system permease subunit